MSHTEDKVVLILGATGMLGNSMLRLFSGSTGYRVFGTTRTNSSVGIAGAETATILSGVDVQHDDALAAAFARTRPDVVINCVGIIKQLSSADDPLVALPVNSVLPHRLARLSELVSARLVQISTDCVFSGRKGRYVEDDTPDATDLYGRSKLLGEVDYPHAVTLRTSIIGHELQGTHSLINWFLAQHGSVKGYARAIFSGVPTIELARIVRDYVLPNAELRGTYHVSAEPIDKLSLLRLVARTYGKDIEILPDGHVTIDRSLDSSRFRSATGYQPSSWPELIQLMFDDHLASRR